MIVTSYPVYSGFRANNNEYSLTSLVDMIEEVFLLSLYWDRLFVTIRIIKGGVHDFHVCQIFSLFCRLILQTSVRNDILSNRK